MRIAIAAVVIGLAIALAFVLMDSRKAAPDALDDQHKAAAILVARCDSEMSSLDLELGSAASPSAAIARRIDACTRAKAAVERAQQSKGSHQLDVAFERMTKHLEKLSTMGGSAAIVITGSAAADSGGRRTGLTPHGSN